MSVVFDFKDIKDYNIVICGLGGTGSNLVPFLCQTVAMNNEKNIHITLADGDMIENKNLKNQKFTEKDLNKSKAEVLCSRYKRIYPNVNLSYYDKYITDTAKLMELLLFRKSYRNLFPVLVGCVDNNATRQLFHEIFYDNNIDDILYIDSGNGTDNMEGQIVIGLKRQGKVILSPVADIYPQILEDNDNIENEVGCAAHISEHPQNIATNLYAAITLFSILNNLLFFNRLNKHFYRFNASDGFIKNKDIFND
jgi:hypothetical protein